MRFALLQAARWPGPSLWRRGHRRVARTAAVAASALALGCGLVVVASTQASAATSCSVAYATSSEWQGGFVANLTLTNTGTTALTGWTVTFTYPGDQKVTNAWNATVTQNGENITAVNLSYNGNVAAGATTTFGWQGTWTTSDAPPTSITCTPAGGTTGTPTVSLTSPTAGQTFTAPATIPLAASASETGGTISQVQFFNGSALLATVTSSPYTFSWTNVAAGTYSLTARATDASGNSATSSAVSVTVNPPSNPAVVASPASLSVVQGQSGTFGLHLSQAPTANVTVTVSRTSGNTGLSVTSGGTLIFTPSNWSTAQNVTITADSSSTGSATFTASASGYTAATVTVTENPVNSGGAPQLQVSGNKLVDQNGNQVILHGVNRSGGEYACVQGNGLWDGPMDQTAVTAIKSWHGVNAVRVPLNEACWNGESYVNPSFAGTNYINSVKTYVNLVNSNGLVAILDLHWTDGTYTGPSSSCSSAQATCQKPMPDAAQAIPFWTSVANTFKGNDAVIFDLFNEPFASRATGDATSGWTCWKSGGTCNGISYQVAGMQQMVNAVRSTGANNVLMLGGEEYSNDLTQWLQFKPTDPDNDLVASWHSYNFNACSNQSCWTSQVAPVIAQVPVVAGEIGENDCSGSYINPLTTWLDSEHTSYLAWAWNADFQCSSGPGLITDYSGTPTAYGAAYQAHLASLG
jgi:endoglucanase